MARPILLPGLASHGEQSCAHHAHRPPGATFLPPQVATGAVSLMPAMLRASKGDAIRPFRINIPQEALVDLRRRIAATQRRSMTGRRALLARFQELVPYWGTDYEWRKPEAKLNALPQFTTDIDGFGIHFVDVRSRHPNALPLLIPHGWLGSFFELEKAIGPLTDPSPPGESRLADANGPLI
jgi:hypothetical protein